MEQITEELVDVDVTEAARLFTCHADDICRPRGHVDLLIGIQSASLFPKEKDTKGDLILMESQFGTGLLLRGAHASVKPTRGQLTAEAFTVTRTICGAVRGKCRGWSRPQRKKQVNAICNATFSFLEAEELGTSQPRRCGMCKNCTRCSIQAQQMTAREQAELSMVEANI